jgi:phosphoribosylaminoimidazole-succinocarboxamide synthase
VILVASDRVSVYDVVLPTAIPDKGAILTKLSLWWFEQLADIVGNHVISGTDVPPQWAGRAIRCRRLRMVPVECVARGYLTGSGLSDYRAHGAVCGVPLPPGLTDGSRLPSVVFTPTTKAALGQHDEAVTFEQVGAVVGAEVAERLRALTIEVYQRGADLAGAQRILVADTKLEFGWSEDGELLLADEVLTPDSSRFWPAEHWQPGRTQPSFDKQIVRDWARGTGWDGRPESAPEIPQEVLELTRARYIEVYERLTGRRY